jgi:4,5-dihydroxyphthalate decarboxylase
VLPGNVESIPGADLGEMVSSGELAAGIGVTRPDAENVAPLITDRTEKEDEWAARGIFPMNHTVVVRDEILAVPGAAEAIYGAFVASKARLLDKLASGAPLSDAESALAGRRAAMGPDPIPYGIEPNRTTLDTIVGFARDQHILTKPVSLDDLFVGGVNSSPAPPRG